MQSAVVHLEGIPVGNDSTDSSAVNDDVIKSERFPRYWGFVRGIHRSPVNSPQKGRWRRALMFLWYAPEQTTVQTIETLVIQDAVALIMTSL